MKNKCSRCEKQEATTEVRIKVIRGDYDPGVCRYEVCEDCADEVSQEFKRRSRKEAG